MKVNITYTGADPIRLHYVLGFIQGHPFTPSYLRLSLNDWSGTDVNIDYSPQNMSVDKKHNFFIPIQELVFSSNKKSASWKPNLYTFAGRNIYSVEKDTKPTQVLVKNKVFGFDLFEAIFFHLTRYEEYYADEELKDQWDMMHEKHQFLVRNSLQKNPIVDQIVEAFLLAIGVETERFTSKLTITHDIDVLRKFSSPIKLGRVLAGDFKRNTSLKSLSKMYQLYNHYKSGKIKDPFDTFDDLFVQSDHRKIVYFMAGGTSKNDEKYSINSKQFKEIYRLAADRGYQIGIHPSYNSYKDYEMITLEKEKLQIATGERIRTSRQHFLRFDFDETITALSDSGIYEDSTLGYQRKIGFRCGTAFTYLLFDLRRNRVSRVSETPMIVMDGALLEECNGDFNKAELLLLSFIEQHKENSHLTINFHNTIFDPTRYDSKAMWRLYHLIIEKYS